MLATSTANQSKQQLDYEAYLADALNNQTFDGCHYSYQFNAILNELIELVAAQPKPSYTYKGETLFKELFAYARCNVMFDSLTDALPSELHPVGLVLTDAYNQPVHYVHKILIDNTTYFLDAFGLFENINDIKARFGRSLITGVRVFDASNKQDVYFDGYKTLRDDNNRSISNVAKTIEKLHTDNHLPFELVGRLLNLVIKDNKLAK